MWEIILAIAIFILGLLLLVKSELVWKIRHSFDVKGGESTEGYIIFSRCIGVFAIIVGIVAFIICIAK